MKKSLMKYSKDKVIAGTAVTIGTSSIMSYITKDKSNTVIDLLVGVAGLYAGMSKFSTDHNNIIATSIGTGSLASFAARKANYTGPLVLLGSGALAYIVLKDKSK